MHIFYLEWPSFSAQGAIRFFQKKGYRITFFSHPNYTERFDGDFHEKCVKAMAAANDIEPVSFAFSYNYFPLLSKACEEMNLKYISLVYDSPQVKLYSYTVMKPHNYIFHFDSEVVSQFRQGGLDTFYYMPLPVDTEYYADIYSQPYNHERVDSEVSFVGSLYNENHNFYDRLTSISDYTRGYLEAIMDSQSKVYGYNFMESLLTKDILEDCKKCVNYEPYPDSIESFEYVFTSYYLERKLTATERVNLLSSIARQYPLKVFTHAGSVIPGAHMMGVATYETEMPQVFHNSKINLNTTLRSIHNGIPMRCMDIMGCGGFLLSNYQNDFLNHFVPDEDFVYFENSEDCLNKIDYYLNHDDQRMTIAQSGLDKIKKNHNFDVIFSEMMSIAGV